jgi:hypothetical protein
MPRGSPGHDPGDRLATRFAVRIRRPPGRQAVKGRLRAVSGILATKTTQLEGGHEQDD